MRLYFFLVAFVVFSIVVPAQQIEGFFSASVPNQQIFLSIQKGNKIIKVDSSYLSNCRFLFNNQARETGYYWIWLSDSNKIDLIINARESIIKFKFNSKKLYEDLEVLESNENRLFWESKKISKLYANKINQEIAFRNSLAAGDLKMRSISIRNQQALEAERDKKIKALMVENPNTFFSELSYKFIELNQKYSDKQEGKRKLINALPLSDLSYLNSNLYPQAIMNILQNHTNFDEAGFKNSIDTLLKVAKPYPTVYDFFLTYLIDLFYQVGPEIILDYLIENYYLKEGCSEGSPEQYRELIKQYQNIQVGSVCPDLIFRDTLGNEISMNSILKKSERPVVLFYYSSHCPFCHKTIDELKQENQILSAHEFIFISLDTNKEDWMAFNINLPKGASSYCDLKGWNSPSVKSLKIHKTPTLIKVGVDGFILGKGQDWYFLKSN